MAGEVGFGITLERQVVWLAGQRVEQQGIGTITI